MGARRIEVLRADSGFLWSKVIDWCEVTDGIAISEASYKAASWDKAYRVIFLCQDKDIREQAIVKIVKSLSLFEDDWEFEHYRYSALLTNMKYDAATIWRVYR